jgi:hypothetical protein
MEELFESAKEKFMAFSDDQRAERLQQCMEIQLALDECHRVAAVAASTSTSTSNDTTSTSTSLSFHHEKEGTQDSWWKRTSKSNNNHTRSQDDTTTNTTRPTDDRGIHESPSNTTSISNEPKILLQDTRAGMKISRFYGWGLVNPQAKAAITEMREKGDEWSSLRPLSSSSSSNTSDVDDNKDNNNNNNFDNGIDANNSKTGVSQTKDNESFTVPSTNQSTQHEDNVNHVTSSSSSSSSSICSRETHAVWACKAMAVGCAPQLVQLKNCFETKLGTTNPSANEYNGENIESSSFSCAFEQKVVGDCIKKNMDEMNERMKKR